LWIYGLQDQPRSSATASERDNVCQEWCCRWHGKRSAAGWKQWLQEREGFQRAGTCCEYLVEIGRNCHSILPAGDVRASTLRPAFQRCRD
ncbi:hypothetical protein DIPPA_09853, partial [Diplonema papillatum]